MGSFFPLVSRKRQWTACGEITRRLAVRLRFSSTPARASAKGVANDDATGSLHGAGAGGVAGLAGAGAPVAARAVGRRARLLRARAAPRRAGARGADEDGRGRR